MTHRADMLVQVHKHSKQMDEVSSGWGESEARRGRDTDGATQLHVESVVQVYTHARHHFLPGLYC